MARGGKRAGAGRKQGIPNKLTMEVKQAIELAFEGIGGVEALEAWAKENPGEFYTRLWGKLLPAKLEADVHAAVGMEIQQTLEERQAEAKQEAEEMLKLLAQRTQQEETR